MASKKNSSKQKGGKKQKGKKDHIKHDAFTDYNITPLEGHPNERGKLKSPFSVLGSQQSLISWRDYGLNEVLWAALVRISFSQEKSLSIFRKIIVYAREHDPKFKETFISHSALSALSNEQFDELMHPLFEDDQTKHILSTLLYIETLPDFSHWERNLEKPSSDSHVEHLMKTVSVCMEHQSQEATDINVLKRFVHDFHSNLVYFFHAIYGQFVQTCLNEPQPVNAFVLVCKMTDQSLP